MYEEKPEAAELKEESREKSMFVFIVDRSGSMSGGKMTTTK